MTRDQRFVAEHRGGLLEPARHRLLALWAADCAEHVLPLFEQHHAEDARPHEAIEATRAWARGEISVGGAREAAAAAHAAAREVPEGAARAAARAAGQAVSTPHMADHALGAAAYAVRAAKASAPRGEADEAGARESQWQRERLPEEILGLVVSAQEQKSVLGKWQP